MVRGYAYVTLRWVLPLALGACSGSDPATSADADTSGDGDQQDHDSDVDRQAPDGDRVPEADGPICPSEDPEPVARGELVLSLSRTGEILEQCTSHVYSFVATQGSSYVLGLRPHGLSPLTASVSYPDDPTFSEPFVELQTERVGEDHLLLVEAPRSGQLAVMIRSEALTVTQGYDLSVSCDSACNRETTRHPIVLVHGWTGFENIGPIDYFYAVPEFLRELGYHVFVASLDPYNSIEVRSGQLAAQVDTFLEEARSAKLNIIAHSQGGLDSRRLISTLGYGDRVSALATIATPHRGTPLTDIALGLAVGETEAVLYFLLNLLGAEVAGQESDAEASFYSLSEEYVQNIFNPENPNDPHVSYYSWMGRTCLYGLTCDDWCDVEIRWSYDLLFLIAGANDGIVPVSSGPWGDYRGEIPADHFDEVGQLFGVTNDHFDHETFYRDVARFLFEEGH